MKEWVVPTLRAIRPERILEASWEQEINIPVLAWRRLAGLFNLNFFQNERLIEIFGSVVARLPEENFLALFKANLFFIYPEKIAEIHSFPKGSDSKANVVIFRPDVLSLSDPEIRGIIIHEIAHFLLDHNSGRFEGRLKVELEEEADQMAISLGFEQETQKLRKGGMKNVLEKG